MRLAVLLTFAALVVRSLAAGEDKLFATVALGPHIGYIVPESYALAHKTDLIASIPGFVKVEGFWTPSELNVTVAERVFRETLQNGIKDPALLFPNLAPNRDPDAPADAAAAEALAQQKSRLAQVMTNYDVFQRQFMGVIIEGQKLVVCNYSDGTKVDPTTEYVCVQKAFVADGTVHFLQCRFDPSAKTCTNVSMIGPWQEAGK